MFGWEDFEENQKRSGKYERKWVEELLGWKREGERKMLGRLFYLWAHQNFYSPPIGEKMRETRGSCVLD